MSRFAALVVLPVLWVSVPVLADAPIATGDPNASPPRANAPTPPLSDQAEPIDDPATEVAIGPCGPTKVGPDGKVDTKARGDIEVGVGTRGYRHIAGTVCNPVGDAAITISAGDTEFGRGGRR